jgi:fission process protein 1
MSTEENSNEIDYFRDSPLRYMGYSNEVGESFRSLVNVKVVHASYVVAFGYVFLDCADKMKKTYKTETSKLSETPMLNSAKTGLDCLVWQTSASVVIPGRQT